MRGRAKPGTRPEWRVWMKRLRWERHIDQADMPRLILEKTGVKISLQSYKNWEVGRATPTVENWKLICAVFDLTMFEVGQKELIRSMVIEEAETNGTKKRKRGKEGIFFEVD